MVNFKAETSIGSSMVDKNYDICLQNITAACIVFTY